MLIFLLAQANVRFHFYQVRKLEDEILSLKTEVNLLQKDKADLKTELKSEVEKRKEAEVQLVGTFMLFNQRCNIEYSSMTVTSR